MTIVRCIETFAGVHQQRKEWNICWADNGRWRQMCFSVNSESDKDLSDYIKGPYQIVHCHPQTGEVLPGPPSDRN